MNDGFAMSLQNAAIAMGGRAIGDDVSLQGVSTDSRTIQTGQLFIALRGPNFDGHDYIAQALEKGAAACVVDKETGNGPQIVVQDTLEALGRLANAWRRQLNPVLIAVTGSNGKTTVKEMLAAILCQRGSVLATEGNLNNEIGLPLTLLKLNAQHRFAVIEMGANHPGEIAYLTRIAEPQVGLITNAGAAHLEGFGSLSGVARAKGELFAGLAQDGKAVINADDTYAGEWIETAGQRQRMTFGLLHEADVKASYSHGAQGSELNITTPVGEVELHLALLGTHNVMNALAAVATVLSVGIDLDAVKLGLQAVQAVPGRLQLKAGLNGSRIIDDTYNANPTSLAAALNALKDFPGNHYLVLGDMGELGAEAESLHAAAGRQALERGVDRLYTVGPMAAAAAKIFGDAAMVFESHDAAITALEKELDADVTLLVKGSRLSHMERVVNALTSSERLEV